MRTRFRSETQEEPAIKLGLIWDGTTQKETLNDWVIAAKDELTDCAKAGNWDGVVALLDKHPEFINSSRSGGKAWFAPLHHAAYVGANLQIVEKLLGLGAWRTLQNSKGERPVDVANRKAQHHLIEVLNPKKSIDVPMGILAKIQGQFHLLIRERGADLVDEHKLRLPELEPILELGENKAVYFSIPGMYGGFNYWLVGEGVNAKLITESWIRVCGGSGQRHEVTNTGYRLLASGFV